MTQSAPQSEERRLQRELRFICIMGPVRRPPQDPNAPANLVSLGLIDEAGWVTEKGREFMRG
jgi:hypothetical protein